MKVGQAWTGAHHAWLARQYLESPATRMAFDAEHETVLATADRRDRLDQVITQMAAESQFTEVVHRLGCLRGISTLTGFGLAVEIGDWHRFTGNTIGAFVGLVPCEHSSGTSRVRGPITKTGNTHAGGCWLTQPGTTAGHTASARSCRIAGTWPRLRLGPVAMPATADCTTAGRGCLNGRSAPRSLTWLSHGSWPGGAGPWP